VLEEPEISIHSCELVREVRELSDLEEIFLFHLARLQSILNDLASSQENSSGFLLLQII
jgi:hypothetical protein